MKRLGLYLHIPFCLKKCAYCDFLSAPAADEEKEDYTKVLIQEIKGLAQLAEAYRVDTVFLGGGTPSVLLPSQIQRIIEAVSVVFSVEKGAEITMEANPGTLSLEKLAAYKACGINRLSLGLQSGDNRELKKLGRVHTWEEFLDNYKGARRAGFENINIDLMSSLPGQTLDSYGKTLEKVLSLEPEHISAYSLIIEEGTDFFCQWERGELSLPEEEEDREMYYLTRRLLEKAGFFRYEISNYARKGFESRHNIKYWTGEEYLGVGLGASSYVNNCRYKNTDRLEEYKEKIKRGLSAAGEGHSLSVQEKMEEFMFLGLRLMQGVSKREFYERFGEELLVVYKDVIGQQEKQGLVVQEKGYLRLTSRGIDLSSWVMAQYLL